MLSFNICNVLYWTGLDLTGTMVDLPDTIEDLPDTMLDLPDTMVNLPDIMVDLPVTLVDLPVTMVDLPDCFRNTGPYSRILKPKQTTADYVGHLVLRITISHGHANRSLSLKQTSRELRRTGEDLVVFQVRTVSDQDRMVEKANCHNQ